MAQRHQAVVMYLQSVGLSLDAVQAMQKQAVNGSRVA
jgi:hypothetical protein